MTVLRDIPYQRIAPAERGCGDLFLPEAALSRRAPLLLIHGGGWNALAKEALDPIARLAASEGRRVFSINYRLLSHAPWPACRDDCVAAGRFVLAGGLSDDGLPAPEKLLVCGASAGAHLAMHTGLALGARRCTGIISLAGPSSVAPGPDDTAASAICAPDFLPAFFGASYSPTPSQLAAASPAALASPQAPPLVCLHSRNDLLVPLSHSEAAVAAWRAHSVAAELVTFDGPGEQHGFWTDGDLSTRQLIPALDTLLRQALTRFP